MNLERLLIKDEKAKTKKVGNRNKGTQNNQIESYREEIIDGKLKL